MTWAAPRASLSWWRGGNWKARCCTTPAGFKGLTVAMMQRLVDHYAAPWGGGQRPKLEREVARLLVAWALPGLATEEIDEIVSHRNLRKPVQLSSVISEENLKVLEKELGEGSLDADLQKSVQDKVKSSKKAAAQMRLPEAVREARALPPQPRASSSAASSSAAAPAAPEVAQRIPMPDKELSLEEARTFCPVAKGCTLSVHTDHRWMLVYTAKPDYPRMCVSDVHELDQRWG